MLGARRSPVKLRRGHTSTEQAKPREIKETMDVPPKERFTVQLEISEPLLPWKRIEVTDKLASSSNARVVVIGAGKDGLPLILDTT